MRARRDVAGQQPHLNAGKMVAIANTAEIQGMKAIVQYQDDLNRLFGELGHHILTLLSQRHRQKLRRTANFCYASTSQPPITSHLPSYFAMDCDINCLYY